MVDEVDMAAVAEAAALTERERQITDLLQRGLTNAEVAEQLGITFATAKWHVSQVLSKLGAERREEVPARMAALAENQRAVRAGHRRRVWFLGWTGLAKGLGIAAGILPVAAISVAGVFILRGGSGVEPVTAALEASTTVAASAGTASGTANEVQETIHPKPQAHTCDWKAGQQHLNDGPLDHSGCDFSGVNFGGVAWNAANLAGANLSGAVISHATLNEADLSGANLRGTWFIESVMRPNFNGADLTGAHFTDSIVGGTFANAICPDGSQAGTTGTCMGRPGLQNLPQTRSMKDALVQVGRPAAPFALPDARNLQRSIGPADFPGRTVVLWWFASWCARCESQAAQVEQFAKDHPDSVVIGMSLDEGRNEALQSAEEYGLSIPIAMDSHLEALWLYRIVGAGVAVTIGVDGTVVGHPPFEP